MRKYLLILSFCILFGSVHGEETDLSPLKDKLKAKGVSEEFIQKLINHESVSFNEKYVKINVTGYLNKPDYSKHYNERSVKYTKKYLTEKDELLQKAETKYGVPKEVIASVLWVETRHGGYLGNNHLVTVFVSTALADQEENIEMNLEMLKETYAEGSEDLKKYETKIRKRASSKSKWALDQLIALSEIDKQGSIDVFSLKGSWAGAFGMSQFLPSSYISWAVDGDSDGKIDLFSDYDAIFSVANYLKTNGWGNTVKAQRKAVYHYNHSNDYVDAVLKLADLIKS